MEILDSFLQSLLKKAIPSIFVRIAVHYKCPEKVRIVDLT